MRTIKATKYLLTVSMIFLVILNILDYLTTIYCLRNVPNAYETNPLLKTPKDLFKFKILYGVPIGAFSVFSAFVFDRLKRIETSRLVDYLYFLCLGLVILVLVDYVFVIAGNLNVALK